MNGMFGNEDCLEFLEQFKDNTMDFVFIDPPYEINYLGYKWDEPGLIDLHELSRELFRVLTPNGQMVVMCGWSKYPDIVKIYEMAGFTLMNPIVWDRVKGRGAKKNLTSTREEILWFVKNPKKYTFNKIPSEIKKKTIGLKSNSEYRSISNVWTDIPPLVPWSQEKKNFYHPTQKPYKLLERILKIWTNEGDQVMDCFMGTGVTAEACCRLNRGFAGTDSDETCYHKTIKRIRMAEKEMKENGV